ANNIGGVTFTIADPSVLEREAREAAIADARERAEHLAELTGVALGEPTAITEGFQGYMPMVRNAAYDMGSGGIATGELAITVNVTVATAVGSSASRLAEPRTSEPPDPRVGGRRLRCRVVVGERSAVGGSVLVLTTITRRRRAVLGCGCGTTRGPRGRPRRSCRSPRRRRLGRRLPRAGRGLSRLSPWAPP